MAKQQKSARYRSLSGVVKEHLFKIIAFDWVGTAVESPLDNADAVRKVIEDLLKLNVLIVVITDLEFGLINQKICWPIQGLHKKNLFVCASKGSEVYGFDDRSQPVLFYRKETTGKQNKLLNQIAEALKRDIENGSPGGIDIICDHLNCCKIDLLPERENTSKTDVNSVKEAVEHRLAQAGIEKGIEGAIERATFHIEEFGLDEARVTTTIKHIEICLADESDSMQWITNHLTKQRNIPFENTLVVGSEFGQVAGFEGRNQNLVISEDLGIRYASVGKEPNGVSKEIMHFGGGPDCFLQLLKAQLHLNERLSLTKEPVFLLSEYGFNVLREREIESIFTIGNGYLGIRGSLEEERYGSDPTTMLAGVYYETESNSNEQLAVIPNWLFAHIYVDRRRLFLERGEIISHKRILDMKKGLLCREWRQEDEEGRITFVRFLRFASRDDPHALVMRISIVPENYAGEIRVKTGVRLTDKSRKPFESIRMKAHQNFRGLSMVTELKGTGITLAQAQRSTVSRGFVQPEYRTESERTMMVEEWTWQADVGQKVDIDKFVSLYTSRDIADPEKKVDDHIYELTSKGFEKLLLEHIDTWSKYWNKAFIDITPDHQAQKWMSFALYHLLIAGNPDDEKVSISARALTGSVYQGHIFWDSELFILPFYCFASQPTARAMLMYRYHTLPAARKRAKQTGYKGALYAWESALTGNEMTPTNVLAPNGKLIPIGSGRFEHHISSAIARGVWLYWTATRDVSFLIDAGAEIIVETARFWASRVAKRDGKYHIDCIEGPDEYHEDVNDNFYTNIMAVWNLEQAKKVFDYLQKSHPKRAEQLKEKLALDDSEMKHWARIVAEMYIDMEDAGSLIEQFDGYFQLEDINVHEFEPRTAPLDVILGRERTPKSQVVKQADVVMALYLLEERFGAEIVNKNFEYYDQRTGHGSSLSPSIYGLVAARIGLNKKAAQYFKKTAQIDLSDNMGNAAGGVHIASLGGLWQQVVMGFAGIRICDDGIFVGPNLPGNFEQLSFSLLWRGLQLHFNIEKRKKIELKVKGKGKLNIGIYGKKLRERESGRTYKSNWKNGVWSEFK